MQRLVAWLVANPCASHAATAAVETLALALLGGLLGLPHPAWIAAVAVTAFYYGREAGQREHELKHGTPPVTPLLAFLGAEYGFRWSRANLVKWLAAAGAAALVGAALVLVLPAPAKAFDGRVSWYGPEHGQGGRRTACGDRFRPDAVLAAHGSLPCGTRLRVTDLGSGRSLVVPVRDRGPRPDLGRALDLSKGAARRLGMLRRGVIRARIAVLARAR